MSKMNENKTRFPVVAVVLVSVFLLWDVVDFLRGAVLFLMLPMQSWVDWLLVAFQLMCAGAVALIYITLLVLLIIRKRHVGFIIPFALFALCGAIDFVSGVVGLFSAAGQLHLMGGAWIIVPQIIRVLAGPFWVVAWVLLAVLLLIRQEAKRPRKIAWITFSVALDIWSALMCLAVCASFLMGVLTSGNAMIGVTGTNMHFYGGSARPVQNNIEMSDFAGEDKENSTDRFGLSDDTTYHISGSDGEGGLAIITRPNQEGNAASDEDGKIFIRPYDGEEYEIVLRPDGQKVPSLITKPEGLPDAGIAPETNNGYQRGAGEWLLLVLKMVGVLLIAPLVWVIGRFMMLWFVGRWILNPYVLRKEDESAEAVAEEETETEAPPETLPAEEITWVSGPHTDPNEP